jgi:hypothetical protein
LMRQSSISRKADCKKVPERRDDEVQKLPSTTSRVPHWASLISDGLNSGHHEDRVESRIELLRMASCITSNRKNDFRECNCSRDADRGL